MPTRDSPARDGTTVLVTGGTAGIGFATAHVLARSGATVYVTGRDYARGQRAEARLRQVAPSVQAQFLVADLTTVGANQRLAQQVRERTPRLHVLINNVGALYNDRMVTADGYEATLAVNAISPCALTDALLPVLEATGQPQAPARIINVVSSAFAMWRGDPFADLQSERRYRGLHAYAHAKLLNMLWALALARRQAQPHVVVNVVNPGMAWTAMNAQLAPRAMPPLQRLLWPVFRLIQRRGSAAHAAGAPVFLASAAAAAHLNGTYVDSNGRPRDPGTVVGNWQTQDRALELVRSLVEQAPTNTAAGAEQGKAMRTPRP